MRAWTSLASGPWGSARSAGPRTNKFKSTNTHNRRRDMTVRAKFTLQSDPGGRFEKTKRAGD